MISNVVIDHLLARRTVFFFVSRASKEALGELKRINVREGTPRALTAVSPLASNRPTRNRFSDLPITRSDNLVMS